MNPAVIAVLFGFLVLVLVLVAGERLENLQDRATSLRALRRDTTAFAVALRKKYGLD